MRTDRFLLTAGGLLGALLSAAAQLPAQDTLEARAEEVVRTEQIRRTGDLLSGGRDLSIAADQVVDGKVVQVGGDLAIAGHVTGDVTVTGGELRLDPGAVVDGDVQVTGGTLTNHGAIGGDARVVGGRLVNQGRIAGEMTVMDEGGRDGDADSQEGQHTAETVMGTPHSWMGRFGNGLSGLASTVALGLLLGGLGAGMIFFAHPQLERVSDSVRKDTLRAGALGIASHFLVIPVFLIGGLLLVLSLIGIPLLVIFIPMFWVLAIGLAAAGLVAVGHAIGERSAERSGTYESRNSYSYLLNGLGLLLAPLVAANLLKLTGFLYGLGSLLEVLSKMGLWAAATVGFGAVLLTRGGMGANWRWKRRSYDPIIDGDAFGGSNA
jgi:hypothetical protein